MLASAEAAQVKIPAVILLMKSKLANTAEKHIKALLTLAAADDFADAGNKQVCGGNGFAVVVLAHIESLYLLGVVGYEDRRLVNLLGEVTLVLGLEVAAPIYGIFKAILFFFEHGDGIGVVDADKACLARRSIRPLS